MPYVQSPPVVDEVSYAAYDVRCMVANPNHSGCRLEHEEGREAHGADTWSSLKPLQASQIQRASLVSHSSHTGGQDINRSACEPAKLAANRQRSCQPAFSQPVNQPSIQTVWSVPSLVSETGEYSLRDGRQTSLHPPSTHSPVQQVAEVRRRLRGTKEGSLGYRGLGV